MKLIVGLGNPGREYTATRHNVGYDVVDVLAVKLGWVPDRDGFNREAKTRFDGLTMHGAAPVPGGEKLLLLKPTTFINLSGKSIQAAMAFYRIELNDVIIVLDDMALPCGTIRLRAHGSSGGHNGLRDIERVLGSSQYARLRVGIDTPPRRIPWKDYVLTRFSDEQKPLVSAAEDHAVQALVRWLEVGIVRTMNEFNLKVQEKDNHAGDDATVHPGGQQR